ncbi:uncharacterized protein LOC141665476 [Apium graveolens]|uniref:uncharacterized protein LOC141665476 n=1 Tax=Apium graveolens TaxID=4045 RepID=UPI003D7ABAE4
MECSNRALARYAREARFRPLTDVHRVEIRPSKVFKGESMDITFREADSSCVHHPHNDALVISLQIRTKNVYRALVDNGSSANILYYSTFKKMGLPDRDMSREDSWVYGFSGEGARIMGSIRLPCTLGESPLSVTKILEFKVLNQESSHNVLLGQPFLREMRVITSIHHFTIKFPTPNRVGSIKGSQYDSRECYRWAIRGFRRKNVQVGDTSDDELYRNIEQPIEEIRVHYYVEEGNEYSSEWPSTMLLLEDTNRIEMLEEKEPPNDIIQANFNGERLKGRFDVLKSLRQDIYKVDASLPEGAPISPRVSEEVDAPVPQGAPSPIPNLKEVDASVVQGAPSFRKEVNAPTLVDAPSRQNDMDYNQLDLDPRISMSAEKMGLAEDTIEISADEKDPSKVLKIGSQLTPRMKEGLLIFILENLDVFAWSHPDMVGIDPEVMCHRLNIDSKNKGIRKKRRDVSGERAVAFAEEIPMYGPDQEHTFFITDRGLYCYIGMPFGLINVGATYQRLVNKMFKKQIGKTMEVYVDDMLLGNPPMLAKPEDGEKLILYSAVSEYSISATLVKEEEGRQSPVYYVSKRLLDAETTYTSMEKLVYALVLAARKLRPYF